MQELQITNEPIESIKPRPGDPRTHSRRQIEQIRASIEGFGFTNPILVDGDDLIIAGHGRLEAAKRLGLASVPVIRLSGLTDAQKRALVIADNKIAMSAAWDIELGSVRRHPRR